MEELIPIDKRAKQFAIRIVKLYHYLVEVRHEKVLSKQVLRSGTSIGANVAEGLFGASRADFINKYIIALLFTFSPLLFTSPSRLKRLNEIAIHQMKVLSSGTDGRNLLK